MRSTYTGDLSKKGRNIDIRPQRVDASDSLPGQDDGVDIPGLRARELSIPSTYPANLSMKWRFIDRLASCVDRIDRFGDDSGQGALRSIREGQTEDSEQPDD